MRFSRWLLIVGLVVGLGCLQVVQHTALLLRGYAVGRRLRQVHRQETAVSWLSAEVDGLGSPSRLAQVSKEQRLKLVAWSPLSPTQASADLVPVALSEPVARAPRVFSVAHVADPEPVAWEDTSD